MKGEALPTVRQTLKRACGVILPLAVFSVLMAGGIISVANDMYAFVKGDVTANIEISSDDDLITVAKILGGAEIVKNPHIFVLYAKSKGADGKIDEFSGNIILNSSMSYRQIVSEFLKG